LPVVERSGAINLSTSAPMSRNAVAFTASGTRYTFYALAVRLKSFGLLEQLDELSDSIMIGLSTAGVAHWSVSQVAGWIARLSSLGDSSYGQVVAGIVSKEMIDGFTFMHLTEQQWVNELQLSGYAFFMISLVRDGWLSAWGKYIAVRIMNTRARRTCGREADLILCGNALCKGPSPPTHTYFVLYRTW
jgi:hypothetical protein